MSVIGATSGKFVIAAAMLMLHGRIDSVRAGIVIAPGQAQSRITPGHERARVRIGIGADHIDVATPAAGPQPGGHILTIGRDLLDTQAFVLDFPHHVVRLLTSGDARRREARMTAVPVTTMADGTLGVDLAIDDAPAATVPLDLASPAGITAPQGGDTATVRIGPATLSGVHPQPGPAAVGLRAFDRSVVILDLAHRRIWVG